MKSAGAFIHNTPTRTNQIGCVHALALFSLRTVNGIEGQLGELLRAKVHEGRPRVNHTVELTSPGMPRVAKPGLGKPVG